MSARHSILAIIFLVAFAPYAGAQEQSGQLDVANAAGTGAFAFRDIPHSALPAATLDVLEHVADENGLSLSENAWDFTRPDSIPGFGSLPRNYDSRRVMPQISGD